MKKLLLLLTLISLTGCQQTPSTYLNSTDPKSMTVVASFYPVEYLAQRLLPEEVEVINITRSKDPHSYELTPQDLQKLEQADLFVFQGANLEPWAEQVEEQREKNNKPNFEVTNKIQLITYEEHSDSDHRDHDDHHEEDKEEKLEYNNHYHGSHDPHTWLDPTLHAETTRYLAEKLATIYPEFQEEITSNSVSLQADLMELDTKYIDALLSCENPKAIISHDAFSYQQAKYEFELFPIAGLDPQDEPTPARLAELIEISQEHSITAILQEEFNNQNFSNTIRQETNLEVLPIIILESAPTNKDYIQAMQDNLVSLKQAFNCQ